MFRNHQEEKRYNEEEEDGIEGSFNIYKDALKYIMDLQWFSLNKSDAQV